MGIWIFQGDEDEVVRFVAAMSLGMINDKWATKPLIDALEDESKDVCAAVLSSLRKITGKKSFGRDSEEWLEWWQENRSEM